MTPLKTALFNTHEASGSKLVEFAGHMLPIWFQGIKEEHLAVRNDAGIFDISHMGVFRIIGENSLAFLQKFNCNDAEKTAGQKMVYSMILNHEGGIKDDVMMGALETDHLLVVNSANKAKLLAWFASEGTEGVELVDLNKDNAFLAVQGPKALETFKTATGMDFSDTPRFSVFETTVLGVQCIVMRTGYTGEDGFEIVIPNAQAPELWKMCLDAGITPCGLEARDSLRIEAGLPLYGQEFDETVNPYMTRYKWVVKLDTEFLGKSALESLKEQPSKRVTVGVELLERGIPRSHYEIAEGGEITSGGFCPSLDKAIAMASVRPELGEIGTKITVKKGQKEWAAQVVKVPFN